MSLGSVLSHSCVLFLVEINVGFLSYLTKVLALVQSLHSHHLRVTPRCSRAQFWGQKFFSSLCYLSELIRVSKVQVTVNPVQTSVNVKEMYSVTENFRIVTVSGET